MNRTSLRMVIGQSWWLRLGLVAIFVWFAEVDNGYSVAPAYQLFPANQLPQRPNVPGPSEHAPDLLQADEVTYDDNSATVTARGHVQISQGERILMADTVSYNQRDDIATANGHIAILEATGDVFFGDYAEVTGDLREALIKDFRALFFDNSRLASASAARIDGDKKELIKGVFSPCNVCVNDPSKPPEWQINAARIVHDEQEHTIRYYDMSIEYDGVPFFYFPYFSHPDPSIKRLSGLLTPKLGENTILGPFFGLPYYGVIDDQSDVTVEPLYYSDQGPGFAGEYRQRFANGTFRFAGSAVDGKPFQGTTYFDNKSKFRGSVASEGLFDLDDSFRAGFNLNRETDRTYIQIFKVSSDFTSLNRFEDPNQLISNVFVEGFDQRNYVNASSYLFQSLRASDVSAQIAAIHPVANYSVYTSPDEIGGHFRFDGNFLSLSRSVGTDSNRFASATSYFLPTYNVNGNLFKIAANFEVDGYNVVHEPLTANVAGSTFNGETGRVFPQVTADWRYPLVKRSDAVSYLINPIVQIVAGPSSGNSRHIPNEDSRSFEFDDYNLLLPRRFPGYDRIATGQRVDYGLDIGGYQDKGPSGSAFIGQSFAAQNDHFYGTGSGVEKNLSDIVGRFTIKPLQFLDLSYRYRLDHHTLGINRQEAVAAIFGYGATFSLSYLDYVGLPASEVASLEPGIPSSVLATGVKSLQVGVSYVFAKYWTVAGSVSDDVKTHVLQSEAFGLIYRDECFAAAFNYNGNIYANQDLKASSTFLLTIGFKYLGDFQL